MLLVLSVGWANNSRGVMGAYQVQSNLSSQFPQQRFRCFQHDKYSPPDTSTAVDLRSRFRRSVRRGHSRLCILVELKSALNLRRAIHLLRSRPTTT